jgi:uncharacterized protein YfiM (DUF2279 family)
MMTDRTFAARVMATFSLAAVAGCASGRSKPTTSVAPQTAVAATAARDSSARVDSVARVLRGTVLAAAGPRRSNQQVLERDEIRATQFTNLYDVVLALRANWLRIRAGDSFEKSTPIQLYLDSQRLPGVEELRLMNPTNIASIRYLDPIQAAARYGLDHGAGAILVTTAR